MLLMVKRGIRSGIDHAIQWYGKANNKYVKDYNENNESSNLNCWNINNLSGWKILQNLPLSDFKCVEKTF